MNAAVQRKRIDIGEDRIEEIISQAFTLPFVEDTPGGQISESRGQYPHSHSNLLRSAFLAFSQSITCSLPSARRCSVSASSLACQAGDSNPASERLSSSHSVSISFSFSLRGN